MTEAVQQSIPGTDVPPEAVRRPKRGRPRGASNRKLGSLFSDGGGDYRIYIIENGLLREAPEAGGFNDCASANAWLRANGGREDLLGQQILVVKAMYLVRIAMQPSLQFKPRGKLPAKVKPVEKQPEPEPASASA